MGPRNGLDALDDRKYSSACRQWDLLSDFITSGTAATHCIHQPKEEVEKLLMTEH
jgi:hypothetical protein